MMLTKMLDGLCRTFVLPLRVSHSSVIRKPLTMIYTLPRIIRIYIYIVYANQE